MSVSAAPTPSSSSTTPTASQTLQVPKHQHGNGYDHYYSYDEDYLTALRLAKPWETDVRHFKECHVSALAAMKMFKHAIEGVEKGRNNANIANTTGVGASLSGTPIEILGLLIGKPAGDCIIITDACPLPVEGSETRVVADDAQGHMLELLESLELRRKDKFVGWYHSHPFDLQSYSHCHLSAIDVETQFAWQSASPTWVAIVVDPFRSLARQELDIGCYRIYPQRHNAPANLCPDGSTSNDSQQRIIRWGASYQRYYSLQISYYLSTLGRQLLDAIDEKNFWIRFFSSFSYESDLQNALATRLIESSDQMRKGMHHSSNLLSIPTLKSGLGKSLLHSVVRSNKEAAGKSHETLTVEAVSSVVSVPALEHLSTVGAHATMECCRGYGRNLLKHLLFNYVQKQENSAEMKSE